jgi:TadE-like protein
MRNRIHSRTGRLLRPMFGTELGSEVVEFAVLLPVLLLLTFGIFWVSRAYNVYQTITRAARETARAAVTQGCASGTCTASTPPTSNCNGPTGSGLNLVLQSALCASGLDPTQVISTVPAGTPCDASGAPCVANVPLGTSTPQEYGVEVSFRYRFHLVLPFMPGRFNRRPIFIPTTVVMRQEN